MRAVRKLLWGLLVVGLTAAISGAATSAAFSSSSSNAGNAYSAGTVRLTDNDAAAAMWGVTGLLPSATVVKCVRVTYSGTLTADVRVYATSAADPLDQYLTLSIETGTMPAGTMFPNCTGFSSEATIYSGSFQAFRNGKTTFSNGVAAYPGSQTQWNNGDVLVYRFTVRVGSSTASQGLSSSAGFTWEARNQ